MQQNSVQLSRDYLFYFTNNKRKTHQKLSLYYNNRKEQQKNIVARLQSLTSDWLLENELDRYMHRQPAQLAVLCGSEIKVLAAEPCSKSHSTILQRLRRQIYLDYYTIPPATQASTCTLAGIFLGYIISTQNKYFIYRLTSPVSKQCIHEFPIALPLI